MNWVRLTHAENIPPREGRAVRYGDLSLAVFNAGGKFLAVENRCPHKEGPLADGIIGGTTVTCPLHNWRICLETGNVAKPCDTDAPRVRTFPVKVENGVVFVGMDEAQAAA